MSECSELTRRERQIMDAIFALGEATVNQVVEKIPDAPTSMAVRRMMHILEEKGHLKRREEGREVVYLPREAKKRAGRNAFQRVLETFFDGSLEDALAAHFVSRKDALSTTERDRLIALIEKARRRVVEMNPAFSFATLSGAPMPFMVDSALKGCALLAAATISAVTIWRFSAATKHLLWLLAFVALLLLPVLSAALPAWRVLPRWKPLQPSALLPFAAEIEGRSHTSREVDSFNLPRALPPPGVSAAGATSLQQGAPEFPVVATPTISWRQWLLLGWAAGAIALMIRLVVSYSLLCRTAMRCEGVNAALDSIRNALARASSQLGVRREVTMLIDKQRTIPLVWGVFRPRLLLPLEALRWSDEQLRSVLLHELAHIRRRDPLVQWLTQIACALHWFNPLVWFAARRLNAEAERACDDLVLTNGVRASEYAEHLVRVASRLSPARWANACSLAMARKSSLEGRLLAVLSDKLNRRTVTPGHAITALTVAVTIALPIAMLRAADVKEPSPRQLAGQPRGLTQLNGVATTADSAEFTVEEKPGAIAFIAGEGSGARVLVHEFGNADSSIVFRVSADDRQGRWWDQVRIVRESEGEALFPELPGEWLPRGRIAFLSTPVKRPDGATVFAEVESAAGKVSLAARAASSIELDRALYREIPRTCPESVVNLDCRIHALTANAPAKAVILPVMAAADLTGPPRSAISFPYITLKPGFQGTFDRMAGRAEIFKVTATMEGRRVHVEGSAVMQFVDGKFVSAAEATKKTEEFLDTNRNLRDEPAKRLRAEFGDLGSNDALVVPIASEGLFPETLVASMTARLQRASRVRWLPPADRAPVQLDGWVLTWPRSEHQWFTSTFDYKGLPEKITHTLDKRKHPVPNVITSESVGTLEQDKVEKLVAEFRKRAGTRIVRVEPFSAKQNVTGFAGSDDHTHFAAGGERASVLPMAYEHHISLNLTWDAPVLQHMSASTRTY